MNSTSPIPPKKSTEDNQNIHVQEAKRNSYDSMETKNKKN